MYEDGGLFQVAAELLRADGVDCRRVPIVSCDYSVPPVRPPHENPRLGPLFNQLCPQVRRAVGETLAMLVDPNWVFPIDVSETSRSV